jgi:hypothetical protein
VGLCDDVANMVVNGQPLLQQLEAIAQTIKAPISRPWRS